VYIVIENSYKEPPGGDIFPTTYMIFEEAKTAAIGKYQDEIDRQTEFTSLYIEKGINIYIHKLPVMMSGDNRSFFIKSKTRKRKTK